MQTRVRGKDKRSRSGGGKLSEHDLLRHYWLVPGLTRSVISAGSRVVSNPFMDTGAGAPPVTSEHLGDAAVGSELLCA
jgi:hypothetical protein